MKQTLRDIIETPITKTQGIMAVMISYDNPNYPAGDYKVIWDRTKPDEVAAARKQFGAWRDAGYMAYSVSGKNAERGMVLSEFDADAEKIIFAPALRGGAE